MDNEIAYAYRHKETGTWDGIESSPEKLRERYGEPWGKKDVVLLSDTKANEALYMKASAEAQAAKDRAARLEAAAKEAVAAWDAWWGKDGDISRKFTNEETDYHQAMDKLKTMLEATRGN